MKHYSAPWSTSLIVVTTFITVLLLGITCWMTVHSRGTLSSLGLLPLTILLGFIPFTIRGYTVTAEAILVHRLFWATRLTLRGLESATFDPEAMRGSIRVFGNGGLYSFTGYFRNKALGVYRAFVTNPHATVVLQYAGRKVVVSPSTPEEFVRELNAAVYAA